MQAKQLNLMVDRLVVDAGDGAPGERAALRGGEILHRMEAEGGKIGDAADHASMPLRTEGVRRVRADGNSAERRLHLVCRFEQMLFPLHDSKNALVIAGHAAEVDRDDRLGAFGNGSFERVIVHLEAVLLYIDKLQRRADMADHGGGRRVGIGGSNNFIPLADAKHAQRHLGACRLRIEANTARRADPCSDFLLQRFGARPGGNPPGLHCFRHLFNFKRGNIRRGKRNLHTILLYVLRLGEFIHPKMGRCSLIPC